MRGCWQKALLGLCVGVALAGCASTPPKPEPAGAPEAKAAPRAAAQPAPAANVDWVLLPVPRQMEVTASLPLAQARDFDLHASPTVDPARMPHPQGYELTVKPGPVVEVVAHDEAGAFYAECTLKQLAQQAQKHGVVPVCRVVDWPDFANRGVMIDVARCKVPEMKSLFELVDLLASWKVNQLQMYTEHTFAYKDHHVVWEDASPMTPAQIRDLDAYCKARHIQLVPNQNSFGHMNRWLAHAPYAELAEIPGGSDLCPIDPRSIELLRNLYADLLPNFSSPMFNVGCDETWSLGEGRSKAACAEKGVGRVYLDFLTKISYLLAAHGVTMQFWADIINNHPELIPELPEDSVAMEWGYEANHPFAEHGKRFQDNGVRFYVVPGTSSWNSLLGRTDNAMANLRNAAENGLTYGAEGYLVTDWGDGGHWQFLPVSYLPYAYGAAMSWCVATNKDADIVRAADAYAFRDDAGVMARVAYDLGNAYKSTGRELGNNTLFYTFLQHAVERPLKDIGLEALKADDLRNTIAYIDANLAKLDATDMRCEDAELIKAEYRMDAALAKFACRLGAARVEAGGVPTSALPKDVRAPLAAELKALLPDFRRLWLEQNRSGGLKESAGHFENLLALLEK